MGECEAALPGLEQGLSEADEVSRGWGRPGVGHAAGAPRSERPRGCVQPGLGSVPGREGGRGQDGPLRGGGHRGVEAGQPGLEARGLPVTTLKKTHTVLEMGSYHIC